MQHSCDRKAHLAGFELAATFCIMKPIPRIL